MKENWILIPVYNDWDSLQILLVRLKEVIAHFQDGIFNFLIVNDGSTEKCKDESFSGLPLTILKLRRNIGHQRAIATGLSFIKSLNDQVDNVIVIDADGEDNPDEVIALLNCAEANPGEIVFSARSRRKSNISFKIAYFLYKLLFRVLTGERIAFGNFSLIPGKLLSSVVNLPDIWNHYSGGIMKSGLKYRSVLGDRDHRYIGKSSMSFVTLVLHGLRSIAVYLDRIAARLLLFFVFVSCLFGCGILFVLYLKYFTELAIPGWTTSALSGLLILLFQSVMTSLFIVFIVLNQNNQRQIIPAIDYSLFIDSVKKFNDV